MNLDNQILLEEIAKLREIIIQLQSQNTEHNEELDRIKNQSSKNSSKPPSLDNMKNLNDPKNKGGAKPGHQAHLRQLIPEQDIDLVQYLTCSSFPTSQSSKIK